MDWVDGTDLGAAAPGQGHARARRLERPGLPGRSGRGADVPAHPRPADHPRRRQAGQSDPDARRSREAGRLRALLDARARKAGDAARPATGLRSWTPARRPRARATCTRWRPPPVRCSRGAPPAGGATDRARGARRRAGGSPRRRRSGLGLPPIPLAARPRQASWSSACARAGPRRSRPGCMTFCMSDIEGSTRLWESQPTAMAEALVRHDELIAGIVEDARRPLPRSRWARATPRSRCSNRPPARCGRRSTRRRALADETWPDGAPIRARFGLHTGEAAAASAACYYGTTVNLAARVRGEAAGGEILLSETTAALVERRPPAGVRDRRSRRRTASRASRGRRRSRRSPVRV